MGVCQRKENLHFVVIFIIMAKQNTIFLLGRIDGNIVKTVFHENEKEIYKSASFALETIRGGYHREGSRNLQGNLRLEKIKIRTRNIELIQKQVLPLTSGSIVFIKGNISTEETSKEFECLECGYKEIKEAAVSVYVDPACIMICRKNVKYSFVDEHNQKQIKDKIPRNVAIDFLMKHYEFGNNGQFWGNLCKDPVFFQNAEGSSNVTFQLALNRKRRIKEDGVDKKTDYPFVKAYGDTAHKLKAFMDEGHFKTGTRVYLDGAVSSRSIRKICPSCNKEQVQEIGATELHAYSVSLPETENLVRNNYVYLLGRLESSVSLKQNEIDHTYTEAVFYLSVCRRGYTNHSISNSLTQEQEVHFESIRVKSTDSILLRERMAHLSLGSIVLIKGTLRSKKAMNLIRCPICSYKGVSSSICVEIDPIDFLVLYSNKNQAIDKKTAFDFLKKYDEIGNNGEFWGRLIKEPSFFENKESSIHKKTMATFELSNTQMEYPIARIYGKQAEEIKKIQEDERHLQENDSVYIEGAIVSKPKQMRCPKCQNIIMDFNGHTEIHCYSLEFPNLTTKKKDVDKKIEIEEE